jgi:hypothetical protein
MEIKQLLKKICASVCFGAISFSALAQSRLADSTALVNYYNATGGVNWINKTNWLSASPMDTWYGITLTSGRVTSVLLPNNNLVGTDVTIANSLTALTKLDLSQNKLSGSLPFFSNSSLQELNLSNNLLSGTLNYYSLASLKLLNLSNNALTGVISSTSSYAALQYLDLSNNQFSGSLPYYSNANILSINLNHNALTGSINYYGLANMETFNLSHNQLSGGIGASSSFAKLKSLDLSYNAFTGALPYYGSGVIESINLSHNSLSGNLPYFSTAKLVALDLSYNNLTGDMNYNNHPLIQTLNVSHNKLAGKINIGTNQLQTFKLENNLYSFQQLQPIGGMTVASLTYAPQDLVPSIAFAAGKLSVSGAGGTLANKTYNWYLSGGSLMGTTVGDSLFTPTQTGNYYATVNNSSATQLTLTTGTVVVSTLPVTLSSFSARISEASRVNLEWASSFEQNFDSFVVERSADNSLWKQIAVVSSKSPDANSASTLYYSYNDDISSLSGSLYYRLKQVDKDGKYKYSDIVSVTIRSLAYTSDAVSVFPNPASSYVTVQAPASLNASQIKVIDLSGRVIRIIEVNKGDTQVKINLSGTNTGLYKLLWLDGSGKSSYTTLAVN